MIYDPMSKFVHVYQKLKDLGLRSFIRYIHRKLFWKKKSYFLVKKLNEIDGDFIESDKSVLYRIASIDDIDRIAKIWPDEFRAMYKNDKVLKIALEERFHAKIPCFLATENRKEETFLGAVWCKPWRYKIPFDKALNDIIEDDIFEINNIFITPSARGKGVASSLLRFSLHQMYLKNTTMAFSRIYAGRESSITSHLNAGFENKGILVIGKQFGIRYAKIIKNNL